MRIMYLFIFLFLASCSSYIRKIHNKFNRYEDNRHRKIQQDELALYKKKPHLRYPMVTTINQKQVLPPVKRKYQPQDRTRKRYTVDDLNDNLSVESLWVNSSQRGQGFLFNQKTHFKNGDIILIQVQGKLKNEIMAEFKRAFPLRIKKNKLIGNAGKNLASTTPVSLQSKEDNVSEKDNKIFDVISSIVIDEINQTHLLIRGRKQILFREKKRFMEIQALVNRHDIDSNGSLASNKLIESQIQVIR